MQWITKLANVVYLIMFSTTYVYIYIYVITPMNFYLKSRLLDPCHGSNLGLNGLHSFNGSIQLIFLFSRFEFMTCS